MMLTRKRYKYHGVSASPTVSCTLDILTFSPHTFEKPQTDPSTMPTLRKKINGPSVRLSRGVKTACPTLTETLFRPTARSRVIITRQGLRGGVWWEYARRYRQTTLSTTHHTWKSRPTSVDRVPQRLSTTALLLLGVTYFLYQPIGTRVEMPPSTVLSSMLPVYIGGGRPS